MSTSLYEELAISKDATPEQVRKAYKKKALLTHPDRLPQGATAAEKAASDERFRKVNNAYEVLIDPKKRSEYDVHGVWPPPEEDEIPASHTPNGSYYRSHSHSRHPSRSQTFPDPFFSHHHTPFSAFQFTDPFSLFNSIFEGTPFQTGSSRHRHAAYARPMDPFGNLHHIQAEIEDFMEDIDRDPFGMRGGLPRFGLMSPMSAFPALESTPFNDNRGRWTSESYMTSTINGVTQTIHKRVDSDGNEHITRTLPDGRQVRTINGVEQQPRGYLPYTDPSKNRRLPEPSAMRYLPPAPPHPQPVASTSRMQYEVPPPPYPGSPAVYRDAAPFPVDSHRRSRRAADKYTCSSNSDSDSHLYEDRHHRKKWWH